MHKGLKPEHPLSIPGTPLVHDVGIGSTGRWTQRQWQRTNLPDEPDLERNGLADGITEGVHQTGPAGVGLENRHLRFSCLPDVDLSDSATGFDTLLGSHEYVKEMAGRSQPNLPF
jgi:hypothetical protein